MLIQCDYKSGDFFVKNSTIYYRENRVSPVNPMPIWSIGEYELYMMPAAYPLKGAWLVVVQSRFPVFYECNKVEFGSRRVILYLTNGQKISVKAYVDGVLDRFLIEPIHVV